MTLYQYSRKMGERTEGRKGERENKRKKEKKKDKERKQNLSTVHVAFFVEISARVITE